MQLRVFEFQRAAENEPKDCSAITPWDPTTALTLPGKSRLRGRAQFGSDTQSIPPHGPQRAAQLLLPKERDVTLAPPLGAASQTVLVPECLDTQHMFRGDLFVL